jgi:hypothetical protein
MHISPRQLLPQCTLQRHQLQVHHRLPLANRGNCLVSLNNLQHLPLKALAVFLVDGELHTVQQGKNSRSPKTPLLYYTYATLTL